MNTVIYSIASETSVELESEDHAGHDLYSIIHIKDDILALEKLTLALKMMSMMPTLGYQEKCRCRNTFSAAA